MKRDPFNAETPIRMLAVGARAAGMLLALCLLAACLNLSNITPSPPLVTPIPPTATLASVEPASPPAVEPTGAPSGGIANPASQNCVKQGGTLTIEEQPGGGQYGVCAFASGGQCEEWALLRGDCPAGGVKVGDGATSAARFCAISGGKYTVTANGGTADERGACTFKDGTQCDAGAYFNGHCLPVAAPTRVADTPTAQLAPTALVPSPTPPPALASSATPVPTPTATAAPLPPASGPAWEVASLLVAPGEPGRLYALVKVGEGPLWGFPSSAVRLMISDDYAANWAPFPGGLPVPVDCMINLNLDYAVADALYASTCSGLYAWQGNGWVKRSDRLVDVVSVMYQPSSQASANKELWAAERGKGVIHSLDGGQTWQDLSAGLVTFGGLANLGIDPRNNATLYGIIRPKYAGSYLRRLSIGGQWQTLPTPDNNITIETGMSINGGSGALYVTTQIAPYRLWRSSNPSITDLGQVTWDLVHDFGANARVDVLASGWSPQGLALYANIWPLTPLGGGGASVGDAVLYRSPDGGQTWQPLATP